MDSSDTHAAPESRLHFLDYWRIIRIRKGIIISVFCITTIIAIVVTYLMRPAYSSTAEIEVEPDNVSDLQTAGSPGSYAPYDPYFMETQVKILQGEAILGSVVDSLDLSTYLGKKFSQDGQPFKMNDSIDYLRQIVSLEPDRNTKLIAITVYNEDKDLAARVANCISTNYLAYRLSERQKRVDGGLAVLYRDYSNEEVQIQLMQSNVEELRSEYKINDTDPNSTQPTATITIEQMQHLNELLIEGQATYSKMQTEFTEFQTIQQTNPTALADVLLTMSPDGTLSQLLDSLHTGEQRLVTETNYMGTNNPDLISTEATMAKLQQQISDRVTGIMIGLKSNVESQKAQVDVLNQRVQDIKDEVQKESVRGAPYWDAKLKLQNQRELHLDLAARIDNLKADTAIPTTTMVTVVNQALPGDTPVRPKKGLQIGLGAFFGLLVGVSLAFFIEYLDTSVKTIDEVERVFQAPVLGVIPQNVGSLMEEGVDSSHAEAYRVLRTNILFTRKDENLNSIVVVSAGMGEGKSTTVLNLATIFAQAGQRTLVVDSDLRRPTLHKLLRLTNNIGLVNYLLKQNTLEQVIQTTAVPMLDFMSSGKLPGNSINVLGSEKMRNLITELKQRYDFILFDSPPIMGLSDASVLASEVDLAIQIIQYRRYPQLMNIRAKQMVEKVGGNLVGIVLNNINMASDESYYYYGGYYYHRNEDSKETPPKGPSDDGGSSGDAGRVGIQQKY